MSEAWEHAKTRALDRVARVGPTPFGYTRDDDGLLVPHPKWARVVKRAVKLTADQKVDAALDYLRKQVPAYPRGGRPGAPRKRSRDTSKSCTTTASPSPRSIVTVLRSRPRESDPAVWGKAARQDPRRPRLVVKRIRGSHHILHHPTAPDTIPVPVHGNQPIKRRTLGNILRTAGLSRDEFTA